MTVAEFKKKWGRYRGKETAAYQGHFDDLCRLLGQPTPAEADPTGSDSFCYQKRVIKDMELFETPDSGDPTERGFADVWKKGCFGWEYKGKKKNLDQAYKQLLRYREALLNPPLLVVCDFDRYIVKTNFNGTVQETHEFTNEQIDQPKNWQILRALFENPDSLKPQRTTAQVTETLARQIADVARSLQSRETTELADAKSHAEVTVAQRKNLRIARFLNRLVFCFFAEDTGLLPKKLFSGILKDSLHNPRNLTEVVERLFRVMATGGLFGAQRIRHFNGHLFEESTVFELTEDEIAKLAEAAEADWQFIQPSIMGNLFERGLDPDQRAQLGAHYTSEADILTLVEPVLMAPFRREWAQIKSELARAFKDGKGTLAQRKRLASFLTKIAQTTVLDPACGSGNFLYVSLRLLLDLEKEVVAFATQLGFLFEPTVSVHQLKAIELNAYAFELAQVSVQIGFLQWRRDNGFDNEHTPVLQNLDGFQNEDALLLLHYRKAKTLKEAQAREHEKDNALKFYTERKWPESDVIVGNPPFLHSSKMLRELGADYRANLFVIFKERVSGFADFCCYWFEKSRAHIAEGKCKRAGLLATQSIRGGASRDVLVRIKKTGDIFFAVSDRDWVLRGANVHISMVGFDDGSQKERLLDGKGVANINSNLTAQTDVTKAKGLAARDSLWAYGSQQKAPFDIGEDEAVSMLFEPNPSGQPNSNVVRPSFNATQFLRRTKLTWVIDFGIEKNETRATLYQKPFEFCRREIHPKRVGHREAIQRDCWWLHARPSPQYRRFAAATPFLLVTPAVSKHRVFSLVDSVEVPDHALVVFGRADFLFLGVLHSRVHEVWSRAQATQVRERESGLRYTPTTCFETFPFPRAMPAQETLIADAAKGLIELRERWLNPPEWTVQRILEFPGSLNGPWGRYVVNADKSGVGTVRYPRMEPRDADCAAKLKKRTLTNLYNERPAWLDLAHKKLDSAVAAAYGWPTDLTDEQILERLLAVNLQRAAEEESAAKVKKPKTSREGREGELI